MGLGTYPEVSIATARRIALEARSLLGDGIDPIAEKDRLTIELNSCSTVPNFETAARQLYESLKPGFRNAKHSAQFINTLETYVFPAIGSASVDELRARDFAEVLRPIWLDKQETASRIRQRMDRVMNWCAAHGYIAASPLPAVDNLLPRQTSKKLRTEHHPAVHWTDAPNVIAQLFSTQPLSIGKLALLFTILTAARSGEVREASWSEIDWNNQIWVIPAERMKAQQTHRVPLCDTAVRILETRASVSVETGLIFSHRNDRPLSDMTLTKILRDNRIKSYSIGRIATVHGFRSTFRDWASENGYPRDVAERALAHVIANKAEAAYHRTDLLDARRNMMSEWESYLTSSL